MWFHFFLGNHLPIGQLTLYDMVQWFEAGLSELGHEVTISQQLAPHAVNLVWENFTPKNAQALRDSGVTYGIVGTEIPDGGGFNWRRDEPWPTRWTSFPLAAEKASFIWSMIKASVPDYARFAPAAYMELGFSERLIPVEARWDPEFDFGFFGLKTPYRRAVLDRIAKHCKVMVPDSVLSAADMLAFIGRSRIGISFRQSAEWPIPSPTRLGRYLHAERGIAAEHTPVATRQGELVGMAPPDCDFASFCLEKLSGPWQLEAKEALAQYRARMPMRQIMERVLDETISRNTRLGASAGRRRDEERASIPDEVLFEAALEGSYRDFNIVRVGRTVVATAQSLGHVDIALVLSGDAPRPPEDRFIIGDSVDGLKQSIDGILRTESRRVK